MTLADRSIGRAGPVPTVWALASHAYAATAVVWLPLVVIQSLDGLLVVAPWPQVASDLGLLWLLGLLPAVALALLGLGAAALARQLGASVAPRATLAWTITLAPLVWICIWQTLRTAWMWVKAVTGFEYAITPTLRLAAVALLLAVLVVAVRRWSLGALLVRVRQGVGSLRGPAIALAAAAATWTLVWPPELLKHATSTGTPRAGADDPRSDVFLISLDTLAAVDADACHSDALMPRLHAFAQGASCFTRLHASSNFTTPTVATMETGLLPWSHFATQPDASIAPWERPHTLATRLVERGYRVHAITDNLLASPRHRGTQAGYHSTDFAHTTLFGNVVREAMTAWPNSQLPRLAAAAISFVGAFDMHVHGADNPYDSRRTYEAALTRLADEKALRPDVPLMIWAHSLPPHSPYLPPPQTKYRLLAPGQLERWQDMLPDNIEYRPQQQAVVDQHRLRYRELMMASDIWLGDFLDELRRQGRLDAALVIVTSDHGESFEKGYYGHAGPMLHEALVRVPLIVKLPGQREGRVINEVVSQADLAPTVLDIVGAAALPAAEGRSLRPVLEGAPLGPEPVFSMSMERQSRFGRLAHGRFAIVDGHHKFERDVDTGRTRLFDLEADPAEKDDVASRLPQIAARLDALLGTRLLAAEARRQAGAAAR